MNAKIQFGTSGWRAIIAEEFTFANVDRAIDGIAKHINSAASANPAGSPTLLVGYDTRFLSEVFAKHAAELLLARGITPLISHERVPTPALAFEIRRLKAAGGINFTASHNPPEYNGIKFSTPNGAPALPEVTHHIEALISSDAASPGPPASAPEKLERADFREHYLQDLAHKVNLDAIRSSGLRVAYDPLYGTGSGYLDGLLQKAGIACETIHHSRDVLFGGHPPEPADAYLSDLKGAMAEKGAALGLATDGDADRFGILDEGGAFVQPNLILGLLLDYMIETRPWAKDPAWGGGAARSVATTHLIDAVAAYHHVPVQETPVGFKYIGELIEEDKIILGGEESAGMTIRNHVPEKDGILACLLTAEMVAVRRAPLRLQIEDLFGRVGRFYPGRWNVPLTETVKKLFEERSRAEYSSFEGRKITKIQRIDGLKMIFENGSWVLFRLSGTEPVCRLYCEGRSEKELEELAIDARKFLLG